MSHKRPLFGTVQTGPAPAVFPWQVEWVIGDSFRCYVGRVHDKDSIDNDSEFTQSRFSANQQQRISLSPHKMSSATLNRNITSMERHAHSAPVKTGSSLIYTQPSRGRITSPSSSVDESLGYATWSESQVRSSSHDTYFVLHKVRDDSGLYDQWCVSVVNDSDVLHSDIKLACFKYARGGSASRANLIQLWKSDILPNISTSSVDFPFMVTFVQNESGSITFNIRSGMVNNVVLSDTEITYSGPDVGLKIYIKLSGDDDSAFPKSIEASVADSVPSDDSSAGYVLLAEKPSGLKVNQMIYTCLWGERHHYTEPQITKYYYYRV